MEWTDTLLLDTALAETAAESGTVMDRLQVVTLQEITLLCADAPSRQEAAAALELLRGFRATGRRLVLCDTTRLLVGRQFGCEIVASGAAQVLVSCGSRGREVGIGARDAGLDLASVLVCGNPLAGGQILAKQLTAGDAVLLLGIDRETRGELVALLQQRLSMPTAVAA